MTVADARKAADTVEPHARKWTRAEYHQLAEMGLFQDQRVELIDGEILQMAPQKEPHAVAIMLAQSTLSTAFGKGYWVRAQAPLFFDDLSEPEPDIAVVPGNPREYVNSDNPRSALLIVEASFATLRYDRREKASLYAAAGIKDYWIINIADRQLEVHRHPVTDSSQKFGCRYADVRVLKSDTIAPLAKPDATILVADIMP